MATDFLNNPIQPGDYVACFAKRYKVLVMAKILSISDKQVFLLLLDRDFKSYLKDLQKPNVNFSTIPLRYCTYRAGQDCICKTTPEVAYSKFANSDLKKEQVKKMYELYCQKHPAKTTSSKVNKSSIKI